MSHPAGLVGTNPSPAKNETKRPSSRAPAIGAVCPLCESANDHCTLCSGRGVVPPRVAEIAQTVIDETAAIEGPEGVTTPVVASTLKMRWSELELERGGTYDVNDIVEVTVQARVIGVSFDVHEPTGELRRVQTLKRLDVLDISVVAKEDRS